MDCVTIPNDTTANVEEEDKRLKISDSAENFQHFIYELFEKNGILNDLRAYLRGHIVEVLKNAQTGASLTCQKHFTQRLELANQALNMLVAEYLLRYDFSYSLSVFVSEIPLANMVFGLAKTLMTQSDNDDHSKLWFSEGDVWLVLNYLGIKCDSHHASGIVEKYKKKESPLLLCILKCLPFYCRQEAHELRNSSMESLTSEKSSESLPENYAKYQRIPRYEKCKHYAYCKSCQSRLHTIKEKYIKKKKNLKKNTNIPADTQNTENLMKNVSFTEKALVDEMFHQLKNVYETEVEMVKEEEEKKYKQVLAAYAEQLQRREIEMEETYKQREADLEIAVQQKKKFLWGLAQALRDQHQTMAAAMSCVKGESERLSAKEVNLKSQLLEAENVIKNRGEEMREQISKEILILESHLEAMKRERDSIDKEKSELENFKTLCESKVKLINDNSQLDSLKKEIITLKKYVESKKCVAEKYTMTELDGGGRMNNQEVGMKCDSEDRVGRAPNQVVNDLKKQKNVNFSQSQLDMMYQDSRRERGRSHSTEGFDEREARRDAIILLQEENDRLKHFARQQEQHIDELNIQTARLQAELEATRIRNERPRTAPTLSTNYEYSEPRVNTSLSSTYDNFSRRLGAGEDSVSTRAARDRAAQRDRRADSRRYLVQQWRALRRGSPTGARGSRPDAHMFTTVSAPSASYPVDSEPMRETVHSHTRIRRPDPDEIAERQMPPVELEDSKPRSKSPKTVLKEAKQKLRNKDVPKKYPQSKREKSPNSVLREAKLRLRKLEIEAEAVEKSYLDFRKRQSMREDNRHFVHEPDTGNDVYVRVPDTGDVYVHMPTVNNVTLDGKRNPSLLTFREGIRNGNTSELHRCKRNLDKFLSNYETKFNVADSDYRIKNAKEKAHVIPHAFIDIDKENVAKKDNTYLETPLTEFRKLYTQNSAPNKLEQSKAKQTVEETRSKNKEKTESDKIEVKNRRPKDDQKELQILKENINKIYNLQEEPNVENIEEIQREESQDINLLRIEVECVTKTDNLKLNESSQDLMLVVQSSAEAKNISISDLEGDVSPQMTVIISPKPRSSKEDIDAKSQDQLSNIPVRLEVPEKLTRDLLDNIYHADEAQVPVQGGSQEFASVSDRDKADDYIDDFSADVDNYNSRSDYEDNSPISHLKTSEDENFWDN